jgi:glycosyltransferase involved in cell wall biosynthesis
MTELSLFYDEPESDRWLRFDRYPRRVIRRVVRGVARPGGQKMVFLNLAKGLDRLGVPYRVNDYRHAKRHPEELVCIVGKPHVLFERDWRNPILFGAAVFSHPLDCPDLFERYPVRRMLVPGEWMRRMCEPYYGDRVRAWPVGIDTDEWRPRPEPKTVDVLIYDKVRWEHDAYDVSLLQPLKNALSRRGLTWEELRYGRYEPTDLGEALARCRAAVFLCEHETQGLAYQQMLSADVPIFAWDRGGYWQDPDYFPDRVKFGPVTSVPYWDERCGMTFRDAAAFEADFGEFWEGVRSGQFAPRDYVLNNLTLEIAAAAYLEHVRACDG